MELADGLGLCIVRLFFVLDERNITVDIRLVESCDIATLCDDSVDKPGCFNFSARIY